MKKINLLFFLPVFLWSQNLSELIHISQENKLVQSSQETLESIKDEYSSSKRSYLPSISIGNTYSKTNHETAAVPDNSNTAYAKASLTIYDGNKRINTFDSYKSYIKSSKEDLASLKNEVALDVVNYYYQYLSYIAQKDAKQKEIDQLKSELKRVKNYVDVGSSTKDEYYKILSNMQTAIVNLNQIELNIQTVLHTLEYVTGKEVTINAGSTVKELASNIKEDRPDIKALEYTTDKLKYDAKQVKSEYLPQITLDNTYSHYDNNYNNSDFDSNLKDQNVLSVNLSWNIFNFGSTSKKYNAKYKAYLSQKLNYEYQRNKANTDLKLAIKSYNIAKIQVNASEAALKAATSTYDLIKSKYQNGLVDNVSFLDALSEKFSALSDLKNSKYTLEIKKANIIYYSGKNIEEYIK